MSRLGSNADVLFDALVVEEFVLFSQGDKSSVGLRGAIEYDGSECYRIKGIGNPEIGMLFVSDGNGTVLADNMAESLRTVSDRGIAVVIDRYDQTFAFYVVDRNGVRSAAALMAE